VERALSEPAKPLIALARIRHSEHLPAGVLDGKNDEQFFRSGETLKGGLDVVDLF
jgi:hypothetical protein